MKYVVPVSELFDVVKNMRDDNMDFAVIEYLEGDDTDPEDPLPPALSFCAYTKDDNFMLADYDEIDIITR